MNPNLEELLLGHLLRRQPRPALQQQALQTSRQPVQKQPLLARVRRQVDRDPDLALVAAVAVVRGRGGTGIRVQGRGRAAESNLIHRERSESQSLRRPS